MKNNNSELTLEKLYRKRFNLKNDRLVKIEKYVRDEYYIGHYKKGDKSVHLNRVQFPKSSPAGFITHGGSKRVKL